MTPPRRRRIPYAEIPRDDGALERALRTPWHEDTEFGGNGHRVIAAIAIAIAGTVLMLLLAIAALIL